MNTNEAYNFQKEADLLTVDLATEMDSALYLWEVS